MKQILKAYSQLYSGAAFGAIHFDGGGHNEAEIAAISILECAQAACLDRPIPPSEIQEACEYLASRSDKAGLHIEAFKKGLHIVDQSQRFEATQQALRMISNQFGRSS
ncbi:MAG: hypothetical protein AAFR51_08895 [Pseudomonadota bacterium]